jgi:hypothetical protein
MIVVAKFASIWISALSQSLANSAPFNVDSLFSVSRYSPRRRFARQVVSVWSP